MGLYGNRDKELASAIASVKESGGTTETSGATNTADITALEGTVTALAANVVTLDGTGTAIPTADPSVVGEIWANSGVLTVSAG